MKEFEDVRCNLCGADDYKVIIKSRYDSEQQEDLSVKFRSSGDETLIDQVVRCNQCELMYINPRIKSDRIIEGYSEGTDEGFISQEKGRLITFDRCMDLIEKHKKNGKVLDVGTAGGTFLKSAKDRGWEVHGIEPNKWLANWGREHYGIDIKPGTIFDHKFDDNTFDVVTLWDVLEHVPDPKKTLDECNRILKEDGLIVVNYPDVGSWISRIMRSKWVFLLSVHLYYFTPKTIRNMLDKTGFSIVKKKPHFQTLQLDYLIFRMKAYSGLLSKVSNMVVKPLRLQNLQIPYWLGQTLIIARKK